MTRKLSLPDSSDVRFMRMALRLARRGRGDVEPNPMVGAIIVKAGRIIARGWHRRFGGPHAEIDALAKAGAQARGSTLYVTLEPCCHTGKTGPCTKAVIAAGVRRVVAAMQDPNPLVSGKGFAALRRAGLAVTVDVCRDEAERLNQPFIKMILHRRPHVIAKWAQSLDGCIADRTGSSRWISGEASRRRVHDLRGRMDAIMTGIGTVLADDPLLTARPATGGKIHRRALRVIMDGRCRLPLQSQLVKTCADIPVLLVHNRRLDAAARRRKQRLAAAGVEMLAVAGDKAGHSALPPVLRMLAARGCANVLVEGGPRLLAQFFSRNLVDEAWIFVAPMILGDHLARHAVESPAAIALRNARKCRRIKTVRVDPDILIQAWF